jgi:hypothetical protein
MFGAVRSAGLPRAMPIATQIRPRSISPFTLSRFTRHPMSGTPSSSAGQVPRLFGLGTIVSAGPLLPLIVLSNPTP